MVQSITKTNQSNANHLLTSNNLIVSVVLQRQSMSMIKRAMIVRPGLLSRGADVVLFVVVVLTVGEDSSTTADVRSSGHHKRSYHPRRHHNNQLRTISTMYKQRGDACVIVNNPQSIEICIYCHINRVFVCYVSWGWMGGVCRHGNDAPASDLTY